jgi:hypothetical protein
MRGLGGQTPAAVDVLDREPLSAEVIEAQLGNGTDAG